MRQIVLSLILFIPLNCFGQFEFKPDSSQHKFPFDYFNDTALAWPSEDSVEFEIRFWVSTEFGGFIQITLNTDSIWNYRRGFLGQGQMPNVKTVELTSNTPNLDSIWLKLHSNHILDLPNQDELVYTYEKDGRIIQLGPENESTEKLVHNTQSGAGYTVELYKGKDYRRIYYYNAVTLNKHFQESGWTSIETEMFANIANILIDSFSMKEVFKQNIREKMGKG